MEIKPGDKVEIEAEVLRIIGSKTADVQLQGGILARVPTTSLKAKSAPPKTKHLAGPPDDK